MPAVAWIAIGYGLRFPSQRVVWFYFPSKSDIQDVVMFHVVVMDSFNVWLLVLGLGVVWFPWGVPLVGWCRCPGCGLCSYFWVAFARVVGKVWFCLSFARGVGSGFFGRLPVSPEYGVWFDVGGCYGVVVVFPSFWGGRFCFGLMPLS